MSFFRPRTTDSFNPFRPKFWSYDNFLGTSKREQHAIKKAYLNLEKKARNNEANKHPLVFPDERSKIEQPVIALDGSIFDQAWILHYLATHNNQHPSTNERLSPSQLILAPQLKPHLRSLRRQYQSLALKEKHLKKVHDELLSSPTGEPESLLCPITLDLISTAYITPYGHVYEKSAILEALAKNKKDPLTQQLLKPHHLIPFPELDQITQSFLHKNNIPSIPNIT